MGSVIGGLFGVGSGANAASQQAANAASQQAQNASKLQQQLEGIISGNQGLYGSAYAPLIGQQSGVLQQLMANPQVLDSIAKIAPQLQQFFGSEISNAPAVQGLDPTFVGNQYSRVNQSATQGLNDILSRLGPGGNPAAAMRDNQNTLLSGSTNLAGTLAGENQAFEQQQQQQQLQERTAGAQGLLGLGQGLNTEQMDSSTLRNQILQLVQSFMGQGIGQQNAGMNALGGMQSNAQQASQFDYGLSAQDAAQAAQQQNDFFNSIVSLGSAFLPGGALTSLFSGGGAGAGGPFGAIGNNIVGTMANNPLAFAGGG